MRWTVRRSLVPEPVEVEVTGPVGTTFAQLRDDLLAAVGAAPGDRVSVAGDDVAGDAVAGRGRLLDGAELVARPPGPPGPSPDPGAVVALVAVSGPDAGRVHPLHRSGTVVGRHGSADAVVDDPDVSRRHCRVTLTPAGAEVLDLGSMNGTVVRPPRDPGAPPPDARVVPADGPGVLAPLGSHVVVGSTRLEVRVPGPPHPPPEGPGERGDGTVVHAVAPRPHLTEPELVLRLPAPPGPRQRRRLPWLAALLPLAVAVPLALWWGSAAVLLLGLTGPVLVVGSAVADRREGRRLRTAENREFERAAAGVRRRLAVAVADVAELRRHTHPDLDLVLRSAQQRDARLWERSTDGTGALPVRVGLADLPGPVRLAPPGEDAAPAKVLPAVPLVVDLVGGLAVAGPPEWATGVVRALVGRLVAASSPAALRVSVSIGPEATDGPWEWVARLPHAMGVGRGPARLPRHTGRDASEGEGDGRGAPGCGLPWHVVVVDRPDPGWAGVVADLARRPGVVPVVLTGGPPDAPGCAVRVTPTGESGTGIRVLTAHGQVIGVADRVGGWWSERLSRALAPLRPPDHHGGLPRHVSLAELIRRDGTTDPGAPVTTADVVARWDHPGPRRGDLGVPLAVGPQGPVAVDLVRDGPHALVAGTTGAGKSELLRSLVLGLAWCHPPEDVALLLVDFKGGAAFAGAAALPHTVGTVTDLDPHTAHRVLTSLRAELRRRERLLAAAGVADLGDLPRPADGHDLPRLVVVVDEFRVLAEEAPDVLDGLVRVAVVGRSLGVHLVLATQRPAGVVSADIRANTSLRIALRVADPGESRDVVDVPDAAALPPATPGRAVLSRAGDLTVVQAARAGTPRAPRRPVVRLVGGGGSPPSASDPEDPEEIDADVAGIVAACRGAVAATGRRPASAPWSPPLPERIPVGTLLPDDGRDGVPGPCLAVALLDLPEEQRRGGLHWRPAADGPLVVSGGPRSGRTTALVTLATAAEAAALPVVVVTADPTAWPSGVTTVDRHDDDHLGDVLSALAARAGTDPGGWVCLLADDADALLRRALDDPDPGDRLAGVLRDGGQSRIAVAVAGGRDLLTDRAVAGGRVRVLLRPADPADAALAGVPARALPRSMTPGRCLVVGVGPGDAVEGQILAPESTDTPGTAAAPAATGAPAPVPPALPDRVDRPPAGEGSVTWPDLPLGVGRSGTARRGVAVDVGACPLFVVSGPPGSGRTTALYTLADAARAAGAIVLLVTDGPAPRAWAGAEGLGPRPVPPTAARTALRDARSRGAPAVVVLDDLDLAGPQVQDLAASLAAEAAPGTHVVLATATTAWLAGSFRGLAAEVRRRGRGLLLRPGRHDGRDVLGVAVPAQRAGTPGRGVLVGTGGGTRVQVARVVVGTGPDDHGAPVTAAPLSEPTA
jgi:S-DNA-T family DNA segregation ATPase FtsK/SpoIIIE